MANITWNQALNEFENSKERKQTRYNNLISEIENSNPECLTASDFNFYAVELNECNISEEEWTPNMVRMKMLGCYNETGRGDLNPFDLLETFVDDETDSIFDFF